MAVADGMDGNMFLDMLATGAESEELREPYALAMLASRAGGLSDGWMPYGLPDSWRAGDSTPDELYGAHVACGLMGDDVYSRLSYCMDLEALGRDEAVNAGVTPGMTGYVVDHEPLVPSMRYDGARARDWRRSPPVGGRRAWSIVRSTSPASCRRARR